MKQFCNSSKIQAIIIFEKEMWNKIYYNNLINILFQIIKIQDGQPFFWITNAIY
jgi:hypothetical protein